MTIRVPVRRVNHPHGLEVFGGALEDRARSSCDGLEIEVVVDDRPMVASQPDIELGSVGSELERSSESGECVLRCCCSHPPMRHDLEWRAQSVHSGIIAN
jgi:hypothetical protein